MIISASRRTDLPAFYSQWFMNRLREGWCEVVNPFNRSQRSRISLLPEEVDAFVFWSRNPKPLMAQLPELDDRGLRYYFQFTLLGLPREIDPYCPDLDSAVDTFLKLAERVGPGRVIWRYDPIVLSKRTPADYHRDRFAEISGRLQGATTRCVISLLDVYSKARNRLQALPTELIEFDPRRHGALICELTELAASRQMRLESCAEEIDLRPFGVPPGRCVDDRLLAREFGLKLRYHKDPGQRPACGCIRSRDIGAYESCCFGCAYCYAVKSFERSRRNRQAHDPKAPAMQEPRAGPRPS